MLFGSAHTRSTLSAPSLFGRFGAGAPCARADGPPAHAQHSASIAHTAWTAELLRSVIEVSRVGVMRLAARCDAWHRGTSCSSHDFIVTSHRSPADRRA